MKILYLITKSNWGGAQRYVYDLAVSMHEKGHHVLVGAGGEGRLHTELRKAGIETIMLGSAQRDVHLGKDLSAFFEIARMVRSFQPNILHLNSSKIGGVGAFVGGMFEVPGIIFTAHGWPFKEDRSFMWRFLTKFFSWLTSLLAHQTIVICDEDLRLGKAMPFLKNKMAFIPLGSSPFEFLSKEEARRALGETINPQKVWFGINAELHPNKGYKYLLEAFVGIDAELVCISDGEDRVKLETLVKELGISEKVHFLGFVADARRYYKAFDVFVLPSLKEGLPYVLLEAGQAGIPVIASNVGGIPDIVGDAGILVPRKDSRALHGAMKELLGDSARRNTLGELFHKKTSDKFSFEKMIEKTEKLYKDQLSSL